MKHILKDKLHEVSVFKAELLSDRVLDVADARVPAESSGLTFEQHKQLLELEVEIRPQEVRRLELEEHVMGMVKGMTLHMTLVFFL